jgi:lipopolysaccharide transport protein LptA
MKSIKFLSVFIISLLLLFSSAVLHAESTTKLKFLKVGKDEEIKILSENMLFDRKKNNTTFSGNVVLTYGSLKLTTESLKINYDEQTDLDTIKVEFFALGNVKIQNNEQEISGDKAYFNKQNEEIILTGNVSVIQPKSVITGNKLILSLKEGTASIIGPVTTTFSPGNK